MTEAAHLREIAQRLRVLQMNSPMHGDDLDRWYAEARKFTDWQLTRFPEVKLPPQVMFYLHDADLRAKDGEYRATQDRALDEVIASLERGFLPTSAGLTISLHPRWLGALALVLAAAIYMAVR